MNDLELLRRFEPVIRYTQGEMFFPYAVDAYLAQCSLWQRDKEGRQTLLLSPGNLDPDKLASYAFQSSGNELFLQYVEEPLDPIAYQRWFNSSDHPAFDSVGRLARVGITGRLAETFFDFSLLLRGRVTGGTSSKAQLQYKQALAKDPRYVYYGRVVRDAGYTILHYLFFYAMNDWRSTFHGVNDHESDWEQIFVYLTEEEDDYVPRWVAFAAHDFSGDDLRRRWDDPELQKVGENHVVVFAGAGSHASYVLPGEYMMHIEPQVLKPLKRVLLPIRKFLAESLSTSGSQVEAMVDSPLVSLAFIDYARGDGLAIGPEQSARWSPELLSDDLPWVSGYRGLWGLDTRDPFGGERAPAGPKFNRDGSVRHAWRDPLGWAGLDKVPPTQRLVVETEAAIVALERDANTTWHEIEQKRVALRASWLTVLALTGTPNLKQQHAKEASSLEEAERELKDLTDRHAIIQEKKRVLGAHLERVQQGVMGDPQAHLRNKEVPQPQPPPFAKAFDFWAAISGTLLMSIFILLLSIRPAYWLLWIVLSFLIFGMIESALRNKLTQYILRVTISLAAIGTVVLIFEYWRVVIPGIPLLIFLYSLISNLRELRMHRK